MTRNRRHQTPISTRSRSCEHCGESYYRRNLFEAWTSRNPGHRDGWNKTARRTCLGCTTTKVANRILMVVDTRAAAKAMAKRQRRRRVA